MQVLPSYSYVEVGRAMLEYQIGVILTIISVMPSCFSVVGIISNKKAIWPHNYVHYMPCEIIKLTELIV